MSLEKVLLFHNFHLLIYLTTLYYIMRKLNSLFQAVSHQMYLQCMCTSVSVCVHIYVCTWCGFCHICSSLNIMLAHICDQICQKGSYTRTVSRHTFYCHLLATSMHQQDICLLLLKVEQSAFTQAFSQACLASTSAQVAFKWPHLPLASRLPAVNHHTTG